MRLDRLLPLPAQPSGRREERPPRRQPEPERPAASDQQADDGRDTGNGESPTPPDHIDIRV
jgi:hypothetical protein